VYLQFPSVRRALELAKRAARGTTCGIVQRMEEVPGSRPNARRAARDGRSRYGLGVVGLTRLYIFNGLLALAIAVLIGLRVI
jgi:hypothetical protein